MLQAMAWKADSQTLLGFANIKVQSICFISYRNSLIFWSANVSFLVYQCFERFGFYPFYDIQERTISSSSILNFKAHQFSNYSHLKEGLPNLNSMDFMVDKVANKTPLTMSFYLLLSNYVSNFMVFYISNSLMLKEILSYATIILRRHYAKLNKPVTKRQILHDSTYMRYLKQTNS